MRMRSVVWKAVRSRFDLVIMCVCVCVCVCVNYQQTLRRIVDRYETPERGEVAKLKAPTSLSIALS